MLEPIREWRLHIGAHKTATTHLQETLICHREWLLQHGTDFLPMEAVRALALPPYAGLYDWRFRLGWPMRRRIERSVAPLRRGPGRIVISEENLIGGVRGLVSWPFYPAAVSRLRSFAALSRSRGMHLFLSVRSFEKLLSSAYAQELRFRYLPGGFEPIRATALRSPPSWTELVTRIHETLPNARLQIWKHEDYRRSEREIMSRFCGVELPLGEALPVPTSTRSPSAQAIAALEALDPTLNRPAHVAAAKRIVDADTGDEGFAPFSASEKTLLRNAYEEDLERLTKLFPNMLMRIKPERG